MSELELEHALFKSRLSLERCNVYLAHLQALLHVLGTKDEDAFSNDMFTLLSGLEKELSQSASSLANIR